MNISFFLRPGAVHIRQFSLFHFLVFLLGISPAAVFAQEDAATRNTFSNQYRSALLLYDHQAYASAASAFGSLSRSNDESVTSPLPEEKLSLERINASFYEALSEMKLQNRQAEQKLLSLIRLYPYNPLTTQAGLQLGFFHFASRSYSQTIHYLEASAPGPGDRQMQDERDFKLAYAYFSMSRTGNAGPLFDKVANHSNTWQNDALYYSAHLAYERKDYETALSQLKKLPASSPYAEILPVYASQIYLLRGDLVSARQTSETALKSPNRYRPLLAKVLGSVNFFESRFKEAATQFDIFKQSSYARQETDQDIYQIGYSYYKTGSYDKAIQELGQLYDKQNIYAQSGLYTLGQSYLKKGQTQNARSAFQLASSLPGNRDIVENSLVYYIKLSYETGLDQDALSASRAYIKNYPSSSQLPEVKTLQANLLLNAHNYGEAYETLKSIPLTGQAERAFQKIAYFYGIETYTAGDYQQALGLLNESLSHAADANFVSLAQYWKAESEYNLKNYSGAVQSYQAFLGSAQASATGLVSDAYYGSGYAYFKLADYVRAHAAFEKYLGSASKDASMKTDATTRTADCYFMMKNYARAKMLYSGVISGHQQGSDYGLYQTGIIMGLQNNASGKVSTLKNLLAAYPNSAYAPDAQYEIAYADFQAGKLGEAKTEFSTLLNAYPSSSAVPRALLNLGLIAFNSNDDNTALDYYKQVISKYPGSPESRNALAAIRNIYIDKGNPEAFVNYANTTGITQISQTGQDSITYQSASGRYTSGDMAGSVTAFDRYLQSFPNGYFAADAHYYRSQALQRLKKPEDALDDYTYLISRSTNSAYTEMAASQASAVYIAKGRCEQAVPLLRRLESSAKDKENAAQAMSSLASCYFKMNSLDSAAFYAGKLSEIKGAPVQELSQAQLILGKCLLAGKDTTSAMKPLLQASRARNVFSAEARYLTALVQYRSHNYKASMKTIFELSKQLGSFDYWVAKSFVLLSDNYRAEGDLFQARSTLLSVVRNYKPEDDVRFDAEQKLNQLQANKK